MPNAGPTAITGGLVAALGAMQQGAVQQQTQSAALAAKQPSQAERMQDGLAVIKSFAEIRKLNSDNLLAEQARTYSLRPATPAGAPAGMSMLENDFAIATTNDPTVSPDEVIKATLNISRYAPAVYSQNSAKFQETLKNRNLAFAGKKDLVQEGFDPSNTPYVDLLKMAADPGASLSMRTGIVDWLRGTQEGFAGGEFDKMLSKNITQRISENALLDPETHFILYEMPQADVLDSYVASTTNDSEPELRMVYQRRLEADGYSAATLASIPTADEKTLTNLKIQAAKNESTKSARQAEEANVSLNAARLNLLQSRRDNEFKGQEVIRKARAQAASSGIPVTAINEKGETITVNPEDTVINAKVDGRPTAYTPYKAMTLALSGVAIQVGPQESGAVMDVMTEMKFSEKERGSVLRALTTGTPMDAAQTVDEMERVFYRAATELQSFSSEKPKASTIEETVASFENAVNTADVAVTGANRGVIHSVMLSTITRLRAWADSPEGMETAEKMTSDQKKEARAARKKVISAIELYNDYMTRLNDSRTAIPE